AELILGLHEDWCGLDARIDTVTGEIEALSRTEPTCQRLMSVPGIGPLISTGLPIKATARVPIQQAGYISATSDSTPHLRKAAGPYIRGRSRSPAPKVQGLLSVR